jgi:hypothetical protein
VKKILNGIMTMLLGSIMLVAGVVIATPAQASNLSRITVAVSPAPVLKGKVITVKGRVTAYGVSSNNNVRIVRLYFRKNGTTAWVYQGGMWTTAYGNYSRNFPAAASGGWLAKADPKGNQTAAAVQIYSQVYVMSNLFRSWSGVGEWQGPTIRVPTTDYRLTWRYSCSDSSPFWLISWNGQPYYYESLWRDGASGSGTWYGHEGNVSGHFEVGTQGECTWAFSVYAGAVHRVTI